MLASLIIVFREVIEAGLIIGILMAATRGIKGRGHFINFGILCGVIGACGVAFFADAIASTLSGMGQEIFNAVILFTAVILLTWHNFWMSTHGKAIATKMKAIGNDVTIGAQSLSVLTVITFAAILREGSEIVLFLYGIFSSGTQTIAAMMTGGALGLAAGATISALTYFGLLKIPARHLFGVTKILLAFLAAGMGAQAILFLEQAGVITTLTTTLWDTSSIISDDGFAGKTLNIIMGYTSQPSQMQVIIYALILALNLKLPTMLRRPLSNPINQTATAYGHGSTLAR